MCDLSETVCVDGGIGVIREVHHIFCHVFCRVSSHVGREHWLTVREEEKAIRVISHPMVSTALDQGN